VLYQAAPAFEASALPEAWSPPGLPASRSLPLSGVTADGSTLNTANQWDIYGSSYQYNVPAATVTSDEVGATVQAEFMVSDSYTGAHSEVVSSLIENGQTLIG